MADTSTNKETYVDSDGSLVTYPDAYKLTPEEIQSAEAMEEYIINEKQSIERGFLKLGAALHIFEEQRMYAGRGYPSMRAWLGSPEIGISYRLAHDLIRVSTELVPKLGDIGNTPVSTLREMLPMLSDGTSDEELLETFGEVQGMTTRDAKQTIREKRGIEEGESPVIFKARVDEGDPFHRVTITCYAEDGDIYQVTSSPIQIRAKHWARWQQRFGAFLEYE